MRNKNLKLRLQFQRDLMAGIHSVEILQEALSKIAPEFHMLGAEAEYTGEFGADFGRHRFTLYENPEGEPVNKPLGFTFVIDPEHGFVIYFYPSGKTFSIEEADELELYAGDCFFYLQKLRLSDALNASERRDALTGLPNAKGYVRDVLGYIREGIPLTGYSSFFFNLKGFG
ncbi:MAG: hypothetical protein IK088_06615, partial [Lachnospiraceae bacterium]|nr:hypothetical protein [Lachnospiraceae bacterium]